MAPHLQVVRAENPSAARVHLTVRTDDPGDVADPWHLVIDASVDLPSGRAIVDDFGPLPAGLNTIPIAPGTYRARIRHTYQAGPAVDPFTVMVRGEIADDPFVISLWPAPYDLLPRIHRAPGRSNLAQRSPPSA